MTRVEVVTTHVDGRRVRTVIRPAAEAGTYHEHQETPTMPSTVKRSRRALEEALDRAATRVETTEQAYHVAAAEVTRLRESAETMRLDVRSAEDGEQAAHDAAAASARLLNERSHSLSAMTVRAARLERERDEAVARAENPRPLTADDITDEMRIRAWRAMREWENREWSLTHEQAGDMVLRAALTPPPRDPRARAVEEILVDQLGGDVDPTTLSRLADSIAAEATP